MASVDLWKTSGHFDFYKEGMFDQMEVEGADYTTLLAQVWLG